MRRLSLGDTRIVDKKQPNLVNTLVQEISAADIDHSDIQQKVFKVMKDTRRRNFEPLNELIDEMEKTRIENQFVGEGARQEEECAREKAIEFTNKHSVSLEKEGKQEIIEKEAKEASENYIKGRLAGKENDNFCDEPGIKIYVAAGKMELFADVCNEYGITNVKNRRNGVSVITLPKGIYSMGWGGCQFYACSEEESGKKSQPFVAEYKHIVRIESDSGKMWQNAHIDISGKETK